MDLNSRVNRTYEWTESPIPISRHACVYVCEGSISYFENTFSYESDFRSIQLIKVGGVIRYSSGV